MAHMSSSSDPLLVWSTLELPGVARLDLQSTNNNSLCTVVFDTAHHFGYFGGSGAFTIKRSASLLLRQSTVKVVRNVLTRRLRSSLATLRN